MPMQLQTEIQKQLILEVDSRILDALLKQERGSWARPEVYLKLCVAVIFQKINKTWYNASLYDVIDWRVGIFRKQFTKLLNGSQLILLDCAVQISNHFSANYSYIR